MLQHEKKHSSEFLVSLHSRERSFANLAFGHVELLSFLCHHTHPAQLLSYQFTGYELPKPDKRTSFFRAFLEKSPKLTSKVEDVVETSINLQAFGFISKIRGIRGKLCSRARYTSSVDAQLDFVFLAYSTVLQWCLYRRKKENFARDPFVTLSWQDMCTVYNCLKQWFQIQCRTDGEDLCYMMLANLVSKMPQPQSNQPVNSNALSSSGPFRFWTSYGTADQFRLDYNTLTVFLKELDNDESTLKTSFKGWTCLMVKLLQDLLAIRKRANGQLGCDLFFNTTGIVLALNKRSNPTSVSTEQTTDNPFATLTMTTIVCRALATEAFKEQKKEIQSTFRKTYFHYLKKRKKKSTVVVGINRKHVPDSGTDGRDDSEILDLKRKSNVANKSVVPDPGDSPAESVASQPSLSSQPTLDKSLVVPDPCDSPAESITGQLYLSSQPTPDNLPVKEYLGRQLNSSESLRVDDALNGPGGLGDILASSGNESVQRRSMQTLKPETWLSDEVIHYFYHMLAKRDKEICSKDSSRKRSHFFYSFFFTKLLNDGHRDPDINGTYQFKNVRRWSKKVPGRDIFNLDKIVFPINKKQLHWMCAIIHMQKKRIQFYDSYGSSGEEYLQYLLRYIQDEHLDKKKCPLPDADSWELVCSTPDTIPQQQNSMLKIATFRTMTQDGHSHYSHF